MTDYVVSDRDRKRTHHVARLILALGAIGLLFNFCSAQTPLKQEFRPFDAADAVYWTGGALDVVSSLNKRELNPLFRNDHRVFSPAKNLTFKVGIWGAFKLLESRYRKPGERRAIRWVKIGAGIAYGALSVWNFQKPRATR